MLVGALWLYADFWSTADIAHKPGARAAAEYIAARRRSDEPVIVSTPLFYFSMLYYADRRADHYLYWNGKPIIHHNGNAALTPEDLIADDRLRAFPGRRVWLVDVAGSSWLGWSMGPVPAGWTEKSRFSFPEAFSPWKVIVVEYETPLTIPKR
jgi:hypothetical protein